MVKTFDISGHGRFRVAVAGGGLIGLSCAFELRRRGHAVTVFDPAPPDNSASWAAAGMIAPAYEVLMHGGDAATPLTRLCFESAALWPDFAQTLRAASGMPLGYSRTPTLALARSEEEAGRLSALKGALESAGHGAVWCDIAHLQNAAGLSPHVRAALELPDDHQVDNRHLLRALRSFLDAEAEGIVRADVNTRDDMCARAGGMEFDAVVWARGIREHGIETPVKGQALALYPSSGISGQVLRFGTGYIVPKPDRIVIGATSEETYAHTGVSEQVTAKLLQQASDVLPALRNARIMEVWTGLRPKRSDGTPLIGAISDDEYVAAAHYRNGVLLAPVTAKRIADMIEGRPAADEAGSFAPPGRIGASS